MIGQEAIVRILKASVIKRTFSCAFLFAGPRGVGKTTAARIFSNAILCDSPVDGNPCRVCESCKLFAKEQHFSFRELDAASFSGKSDMIKLRKDATYTSVSDKKIILLDEAHDISTAGQDVLLKQVEQAPAHLIYMFCTTDPDKMAKTLRDRCMEFQVHKIEQSQILSRLVYICEKEKFKFQEEALVYISEKSGGHVRNALNILEEVAYLDEISMDNINLIYRDYEHEVFSILSNLGKDLPQVIKTYRSISSYLPVAQFYSIVLSLVNDTVKKLSGCDDFTPRRLAHVEELSSIHGFSMLEFLNYLVQRDKYIDKIGVQSDLIIMHYKYSANSFVPQQVAVSAKPLVLKKEPEKNPSKTTPEKTARLLQFSELQKLNIRDRNKLLRETRKTQKNGHKEQEENVAKTWPLPTEKRDGEDSQGERICTAQEFSLGLVGGRSQPESNI